MQRYHCRVSGWPSGMEFLAFCRLPRCLPLLGFAIPLVSGSGFCGKVYSNEESREMTYGSRMQSALLTILVCVFCGIHLERGVEDSPRWKSTPSCVPGMREVLKMGLVGHLRAMKKMLRTSRREGAEKKAVEVVATTHRVAVAAVQDLQATVECVTEAKEADEVCSCTLLSLRVVLTIFPAIRETSQHCSVEYYLAAERPCRRGFRHPRPRHGGRIDGRPASGSTADPALV